MKGAFPTPVALSATASYDRGAMVAPSKILEVLRANRSRIAELGALRPGVFGSVARGDAGPDSDVDLLVERDET